MARRICKERRTINLSSLLILASLAFFLPLASAQEEGHNPANLIFASICCDSICIDSICSGCQSQRTCNRNLGGRDLLKFSRDSIGGDDPKTDCYNAGPNVFLPSDDIVACAKEGNTEHKQESSPTVGNTAGDDSKSQSSEKRVKGFKPADFNRDIYYADKLEFSLDVGWLPINVPFPFDVFEGDAYVLYPLRYTLVPILGSLRWHLGDIRGPLILRGNWDATFSLSVTAIPRGAETRYFSYDMGVRRNFVPKNWRVAPYWDVRAGLGFINAKGPLGVYFAQGQDFTFTLNMGSGVRYNFNPRYSITAGLNWMHVSNANLSAPQYSNYGINVYGPMFGINIQLRRHQRNSEH